MHDVLRFWLDRGVDGFRIDVVFKLGKDPLGDNEPGHRHDQDWPSVHERLRRIRAVLDEYDERMIVGEVYLRDLRQVVTNCKLRRRAASGPQLRIRPPAWDAPRSGSVAEFRNWRSGPGPRGSWRTTTTRGWRPVTPTQAGKRRPPGPVAMMLCVALRGTPFIFQGQELGLPDAEVPTERVLDVDGRDPERSPIPWLRPSRAGTGAGFSTGAPWLPIVAGAEQLCVEAQQANPFNSALHASAACAARYHAGVAGWLPARA